LKLLLRIFSGQIPLIALIDLKPLCTPAVRDRESFRHRATESRNRPIVPIHAANRRTHHLEADAATALGRGKYQSMV
jgi:hypothetical protein